MTSEIAILTIILILGAVAYIKISAKAATKKMTQSSEALQSVYNNIFKVHVLNDKPFDQHHYKLSYRGEKIDISSVNDCITAMRELIAIYKLAEIKLQSFSNYRDEDFYGNNVFQIERELLKYEESVKIDQEVETKAKREKQEKDRIKKQTSGN